MLIIYVQVFMNVYVCIYLWLIIKPLYPKGMIHGALWHGDLIMEPVNGSSQTSSANSPLLVSLNSKSSQADIRGQISDRDY